jgi:transcriptional/translational regulatory protein YebC/TACO1
VSAIKHVFSKHGGNLGASGSVSWQFDSRGVIYWPAETPEDDTPHAPLTEAQEMTIIDAGAIDITSSNGQTIIYTAPENLDAVNKIARAVGLVDTRTDIEWVPRELIKPEDPGSIRGLLEELDDEDNVSAVYTNADL